jgi:hypothetical protein
MSKASDKTPAPGREAMKATLCIAALLCALVLAQDTSQTYPTLHTSTSFQIWPHGASEPIVKINLDTGKITYGKDYTPDAAAKALWDAVAANKPTPEDEIVALKGQIAILKAQVRQLEAKCEQGKR